MSKIQIRDGLLLIARLFAFLITMLLAMLSFDSFNLTGSSAAKLLSFLIHLLPALAVLSVLLIYWRSLFYSGIAFLILSIAFTVFFKTYNNLHVLMFYTVPLALIGVLFIGAAAVDKKVGVQGEN